MDRNKTFNSPAMARHWVSPPARVAWIETGGFSGLMGCPRVATREGGVDRNILRVLLQAVRPLVATREGGVDRNWSVIRSLS